MHDSRTPDRDAPHDVRCECLRDLATAYLRAKEWIIFQGFAPEVDWQYDTSLDDLTETSLLREMGWVILSAGMSERVIRRVFPRVSHAFLEWQSSALIAKKGDACQRHAMRAFGHRGKIAAILSFCQRLQSIGFTRFIDGLRAEGADYLLQFSYLGPATSCHLAKNLGLQVAKPDRHLIRIARVAGYATPAVMCGRLAESLQEPVNVVDLVIWRFATLRKDSLAWFQPVEGSRRSCCQARVRPYFTKSAATTAAVLAAKR